MAFLSVLAGIRRGEGRSYVPAIGLGVWSAILVCGSVLLHPPDSINAWVGKGVIGALAAMVVATAFGIKRTFFPHLTPFGMGVKQVEGRYVLDPPEQS